MVEVISESIVIILDASRSSFRNDYSPNRLTAMKKAVVEFAREIKQKDLLRNAHSAFAVVSFDSNPTAIFDFSDDPSPDQIESKLDPINPQGKSALGEAIGVAIKMIIADLQRVGVRAPRIVLFSDGKATQTKIDPMKMLNLAQQLGIRIDTFRIGEVESFNIMKRIADTTAGKYTFAKNSAELISAAGDLGRSMVDNNEEFFKRYGTYQVLKKIAAPLKDETEMTKGTSDQKDLISRIRGTQSYNKCSICFMPDDPISKSNFGISGRYCPNCAQPMHISCASLWSRHNNKEGDGTVFRCPHCFYLLKVPVAIHTAVKMAQEVKKDAKIRDKSIHTYTVIPNLAGNLGEAALYSACPVCNDIFDEDDQVIKCGNSLCNAIYHLNCFNELNGVCKSCGSVLNRQ